MAAMLRISRYLRWVEFYIEYDMIVTNYHRKSIFDVDGVINGVAACCQIQPVIFMFNFHWYIFRDNF